MKRFIAVTVLILAVVFGTTGPAFSADLATFQNEQQAQQH